MTNLTRREFLQTTGAITLAATSARAADAPGVAVVDTHTHFYDPTRPQGVPWPGKDDAFLYRPVLPAEYRQLTKPHAVIGTIVVEASPWAEDNFWMLDLAAKDPFLLGLVGHLDPGSEDFTKHAAKCFANPKFVGLRVNEGLLAKGLEQPAFLADLKKLQDTGRELDVNGGPSLLPLVDQLATKLLELRIVINHLANIRIDGPKIDAEWQKNLAAAARHPNVFLKVSALVEGASQGNRKSPEDPAYYRPVLDVTWQTFGEDRVIYGSNWPVSARFGSYAVVQSIVQAYAADKGRAASEKFFLKNAQEAYRWP